MAIMGTATAVRALVRSRPDGLITSSVVLKIAFMVHKRARYSAI